MDAIEHECELGAALLRAGVRPGSGASAGIESTGVACLDGWLPGGGLPAGCAVEVMCQASGLGMTLFLPWLARLTRAEQHVALIDPENGGMGWYPPALAHAGVLLDRLLLLTPHQRSEALWAAEECLKSGALALTVVPVARLTEIESRRLALAAEKGASIALLLRPASEAGRASALRLGITPVPGPGRAFRVEILRARGAMPPAPLVIEVNDRGETLDMLAAAQPALPAVRPRAASA